MIKDWNIVFGSIGKQQNFVLILATIAIIVFTVCDYLENLGFQDLFLKIIKNIALMLAIYYLAYTLILTKKFVDKTYK